MTVIEIIMLSVGLAMDAFAVAVCKGLALSRLKIRHYITVGLWFGGFQALMPYVGFVLGNAFSSYIQRFDNYIAFALLCLIGCNMIREAFKVDEDKSNGGLGFFSMLILALATSIDALAVGVTLAFYEVNILNAVLLIGVITFVIAMIGVRLGNIFGTRYKQKAEIAGGAILIVLALKLLLEALVG